MLITAENGNQYNKPDLSHVLSLKQNAEDLTQMPAEQFVQENNLTLLANTWVTAIDRQSKRVICGEQQFSYQKLVLATGARAATPSIVGGEYMVTLNSQQEYCQHQNVLQAAKHVLYLVVGSSVVS